MAENIGLPQGFVLEDTQTQDVVQNQAELPQGFVFEDEFKQERRNKAQENIKRERKALEEEDFGVKNIARDVLAFTPLVGGFVDNAEAFILSKVKGTDMNDELSKVRNNQRNYAKLVKDQGLGAARTVGNVIGGFGGGLALPPILGGATKTAKVASAALEGYIEGAGFADERAKEGGKVGSLISAGMATLFGASPVRQLDEVAEKTGDIRKLASDNKLTNLLIRGIDSSKRIANNIKEVVDVALSKNKDDVADLVRKSFGEDVLDVAGITQRSNQAFGKFLNKSGNDILPVAGANSQQRVGSLIQELNLTPSGQKALRSAVIEAGEDTGQDLMSLNTLQIAKQKLDDRINFNIKEKTTSSNFVLKQTKNKLNKLLKDTFPGFAEVQAQRKLAFDVADAFESGFNFSPTSKKSLLKIVDESGRERVFKNWTIPEQQAFNQGIKANLTNKVLSGTETTNIANSLSANRRLIKEVLPEKEANKLIKDLIKESNTFKNMTTLSSKSRNRIQDRGSLNRLLGRNLTVRNAGLPIAAGAVSPALGAGVLGAQVAGRAGRDLLSARTAQLALQGVEPSQFTGLATALQGARGAGKFIREE